MAQEKGLFLTTWYVFVLLRFCYIFKGSIAVSCLCLVQQKRKISFSFFTKWVILLASYFCILLHRFCIINYPLVFLFLDSGNKTIKIELRLEVLAFVLS